MVSKLYVASGCGSVGRAVASKFRFQKNYLSIVNCIEKTNINKKWPIFKTKVILSIKILLYLYNIVVYGKKCYIIELVSAEQVHLALGGNITNLKLRYV